MLTQNFLDFLSQAVANVLGLIPPMPPELDQAVTDLEGAASTIGSQAASFGILVPWDVLSGGLQVVVAVLGFWAALLVVRGVLWLVGR